MRRATDNPYPVKAVVIKCCFSFLLGDSHSAVLADSHPINQRHFLFSDFEENEYLQDDFLGILLKHIKLVSIQRATKLYSLCVT